MNIPQLIWLAAALAGVLVVVPLALLVVRRQPARPAPAVRIAWLVAATTSGMMLISIGAKVADLIPNATVVDAGALAVTGILTGLFLALAVKPSPGNGAN